MHRIINADCLTALRTLPDNSVDAVVTDPPYGLSNTDPAHVAEAVTAWVGGDREFLPAVSGGFMGKAWDSFVPPVAVWDECLRVLKPGGHLLAFAGSRTQDLMGLSIRLAGFDIRDSFAWLYGSGFPKSMDISKAIDKARDDSGEVRVVCRWLRAKIEEHPSETVRSISERFGFHPRMVEHWAARDTDSQPTLPKLEQWDALRSVLGFSDELDGEVLRLNLRKGEPGEAWKDRPVTGKVQEWTDRTNFTITSRDGLRRDTPATDAAKQWEGWGTALKPAFEPVIMARKPFKGTVAANVLEHGTGALNIDASRIHSHDSGAKSYTVQRMAPGAVQNATGKTHTEGVAFEGETKAGRFPANVLLDESQAAVLDEQSGTLKSGANPTRRASPKFGTLYGDFDGQEECTPARGADSGGASRFFYVAKAPKKERPVVDGVAHPTVKPLALMRYLVRMVTPPGGTVLEPFAGSGTTLEAALLEDFGCIAIEREAEYIPLIEARADRVLTSFMEDLL